MVIISECSVPLFVSSHEAFLTFSVAYLVEEWQNNLSGIQSGSTHHKLLSMMLENLIVQGFLFANEVQFCRIIKSLNLRCLK